MLKKIESGDISIKPFKTYKQFTLTEADSGSGVIGLETFYGTSWDFDPINSPSQSYSKSNYPYSQSFYKEPAYQLINHLYYSDSDQPWQTFGGNRTEKEKRKLHDRANIITIPQEYFGEKIHPGSLTLTDDFTSETVVIKDDKYGNLYDIEYSASFASYSSNQWDVGALGSENGSGSVVGNVFYSHGIVVITDTGSRYVSCSLGTGSDGFSTEFRSTHTILEHEYVCRTNINEFNFTTNPSVSHQRSGSITVTEGTPKIHIYFPPGDKPISQSNSFGGSGSYQTSYQATEFFTTEATHSDWSPYVTTVGLYTEGGDLAAVGKLAKPIKNDDSLPLNFVVRFDV